MNYHFQLALMSSLHGIEEEKVDNGGALNLRW